MRVHIQAGLFADARAMRKEFEALVGPDRSVPARRLCWDYWYVGGQFGYIRTFARSFFSPALYRSFSEALTQWGYDRIGCRGWTEPWLSYYIDGCFQDFHSDVLHGPWAWVYSLTDWDARRFSGGETVLLNDAVLDYWRHFQPGSPVEADGILHRIPPRFNQLTVFDARVPHAVAQVEGTRQPIDSRVVLHGWFLPPEIHVAGGLRFRDIEASCLEVIGRWQRKTHGTLDGVLAVRLEVEASGAVTRCSAVSSTLVSLRGDDDAADQATQQALGLSAGTRFSAAAAHSVVTLPFSATNR